MSGSLIIQVPGAYSGEAVAYDPAVTDGLLAWHYYGTSATRANRNFREGGVDATEIGAPTHGAGFSTYASRANYQRLGVAETADMTQIVVARMAGIPSNNNTNAAGMSTWSINVSGAGLHFITPGNPRATRHVNNSGTPLAVNANVAAGDGFDANWLLDWQMYAATFQAGVGITMRALSRGLSTTVAEARTPILPAEGVNMRVGSELTTYSGGVSIAHAAVYNRVLTSTELAAIRSQVQAYCAALPTPITGF
jgi:hypothetical protein